jgi:hypothetical protein
MIDGQINIIIISLKDSVDRVAHACMINVYVMPTRKESSRNLPQDEKIISILISVVVIIIVYWRHNNWEEPNEMSSRFQHHGWVFVGGPFVFWLNIQTH